MKIKSTLVDLITWFSILFFYVLSPLFSQGPALQDARTLFQKGNYRGTIRRLNKLISRKDSPAFQARFLRGKARMLIGELRGANQDAEFLLNNDSNHYRGYLLMAKVKIQRNQRDRAKTLLQRVLSLKKNHEEATKLLGLIYWNDKQYQKTLNTLSNIPTQNTYNPQLLIALAQSSLCLGKKNQASHYAKIGQKQFPSNHQFHRIKVFTDTDVSPTIECKIHKITSTYQNGRRDQALQKINRLINKHSELAHLYAVRARLYDRRGNKQKAMKDALQAWKKDQSLFSMALLIGHIHQKSDRHEKAETWFGRALETNPSLGEAKVHRGISLAELGKYKQALPLLHNHVNRTMQNQNAQKMLLKSYIREGYLIPARRLLQQQSQKQFPPLKEALKQKLNKRQETEKGTLKNKTYTNEKLGFSFPMPENWTYTVNTDSPLMKGAFFNPSSGDRLLITSRKIPPHFQNKAINQGKTQSNIRAFLVRELLYRQNKNFEFQSGKTRKIKERNWYTAVFQNTESETIMHIAVTFQQDRIVSFFYVSNRSLNRARKGFEQMLNQLQWTDDKSAR